MALGPPLISQIVSIFGPAHSSLFCEGRRAREEPCSCSSACRPPSVPPLPPGQLAAPPRPADRVVLDTLPLICAPGASRRCRPVVPPNAGPSAVPCREIVFLLTPIQRSPPVSPSLVRLCASARLSFSCHPPLHPPHGPFFLALLLVRLFRPSHTSLSRVPSSIHSRLHPPLSPTPCTFLLLSAPFLRCAHHICEPLPSQGCCHPSRAILCQASKLLTPPLGDLSSPQPNSTRTPRVLPSSCLPRKAQAEQPTPRAPTSFKQHSKPLLLLLLLSVVAPRLPMRPFLVGATGSTHATRCRPLAGSLLPRGSQHLTCHRSLPSSG